MIAIKKELDEYCTAQGFQVSEKCKFCFMKFDPY